MKPFARILALVGLALAPQLAGAQLQPSPLEESSPRAKRAKPLAEYILAGDSAKAVEYLNMNGAQDYARSERAARELATVLQQVKAGTLVIARYDALGTDLVGVPIKAKDEAQAPRAILMRIGNEAPYRISGIQVVQIQGGGGGN